MNLRQIYMALMLVKENTFSQAAETCFMSQSSFSKGIRSLEEELGATLFTRTKKGVNLTPQGKIFIRYAREIDERYQSMRAAMMRQSSHRRGLSLGMMNVATAYQMMPTILEYQKENADVELSIQELEPQLLLAGMNEMQFDMVIALKEIVPDNLHQYPLLDDHMVLIVPHAHHLAQEAGEISLTMVNDAEFILANPFVFKRIDMKVFQMAGFEPNVIHTTAHPYTMLQMVARGLGLGIISFSSYNYYQCPGVSAVEITEKYHTRLVACCFDPEEEHSKRLISFLTAAWGKKNKGLQ